LATIDEERLARIRQVSRSAAVVAFVVFLALLGFSAYQLVSINQRIAKKTAELQALQRELQASQESKEKLDETLRTVAMKLSEIMRLSREVESSSNRRSPIYGRSTRRAS
jgi:uncharacterized protein HemX